MLTATLDDPMADKAKIVPAKLHADVMESARIVAAFQGKQIQDLLSDILRPILAEMELEAMERRREALDPGSPRRKPKGPPRE